MINGQALIKSRFQGSAVGEREREREEERPSINPRPAWERSTKKMKEHRGGGVQKRKMAPLAVFRQGRNYTFTEVFPSNDGFHRSNRLDLQANFQHEI